LLPWSVAAYERAKAVMGPDYWSYGVAGNRHVLETLARYSFEQGALRPQARRRRDVRALDLRPDRDLTARPTDGQADQAGNGVSSSTPRTNAVRPRGSSGP